MEPFHFLPLPLFLVIVNTSKIVIFFCCIFIKTESPLFNLLKASFSITDD